MSLINQMLNELERRGAGELPGEQAVRAVPASHGKQRGWQLAVLATLLVAGLSWGYFTAMPQPPVVGVPVADVAVALPVSVPAQLESPALNSNPVAPAPAKSIAAVPVRAPTPAVNISEVRKPEESSKVRETQAVVTEAPLKQITPPQQADHDYRQAMSAMRQGRVAEAVAGYESALRLDAGHDNARWALVGWLVENKRHEDAEWLLREGLKLHPRHTGFAMLLARLQVEANDLAQALETMNTTLPHAGQQADYRAFMAALLQRMNRHAEAIPHYQIALQHAPDSAVWLMGMAISLQAEQRNADALEIFRRAAALHTLSAELQTFVERRIAELSR